MVVHPKNLAPQHALRDRPVRPARRQAARLRRSRRRDGPGRGWPDGRRLAPTAAPIWSAVRRLGRRVRPEQVVVDAAHAMTVSCAQGDQRCGTSPSSASPTDSMAQRRRRHGRAAARQPAVRGLARAEEGHEAAFKPLLHSSDQSALIAARSVPDAADPATLLDGFKPTGQTYTLAARVQGMLKTAFPSGAPPPATGTIRSRRPRRSRRAMETPTSSSSPTPTCSPDRLWIRRQPSSGSASRRLREQRRLRRERARQPRRQRRPDQHARPATLFPSLHACRRAAARGGRAASRARSRSSTRSSTRPSTSSPSCRRQQRRGSGLC